MKTLIVYYSRSGRTRKIAEQISLKLKAEIEEIRDHRNRKGIFGFITSGNEAYLGRVPIIDKLKQDPAHYDVVVIGTPIWANHISTPVQSFLQEYKDNLKKVAFFCTSMGSDPKPVFTNMRKIIAQDPIVIINITTRDIRHQYHIEMVDEFVQKIKRLETETELHKNNDK
jgi:flavodoxin